MLAHCEHPSMYPAILPLVALLLAVVVVVGVLLWRQAAETRVVILTVGR